ncbi:MAG: MCE family protein [Nocardioidaceae bacterium]|nr:MCE family protein [Nocardioidaceae bacterium]MCL2611841.1 MCE family protein [Nocardioidaceae bacterium]
MSGGRVRDASLGLTYLLAIALVVTGTWAAYNQVLTHRDTVTLTTASLGNALQKGSDVKLNGVPVGTVSGISPRPDGAELTLAVDPHVVGELTSTTTARLLPKTLFGERYVALVPGSGGGPLRSGDTIHQDTSEEAVELSDVLDQLLPVLRAIQPDKLSATLGELASMLRGNGADIGRTMTDWGSYLRRFNPVTVQLTDDLAAVGKVADGYAAAAPDLLDALQTMTRTSATVAAERTELTKVFANVTVAGNTTGGWMHANSQSITVLADRSRAALAAVAPYATEFPCVLKSARDFIPVMDKNLGKGTQQPGIHVVLNVEPSRGRYLAGKDTPTLASHGAPRCPYETGRTGPAPRAASTASGRAAPRTIPPPPTTSTRRIFTTAGGLGDANSPAENELIAELVAPTQGLAPADFPDWASLLLGPTLRGTEVELR